MDAKTRLAHLVLTLPPPYLQSSLRDFFSDREKTVLIQTTGNATEGFATIVWVNKSQWVKAKGRTQRESDTAALRQAWSKLITASKGAELPDIEERLCAFVSSARKAGGHPRPVSVFDFATTPQQLSPSQATQNADQSVDKGSFVSDICEDDLLQRMILAKQLHQSLAENSQKNVSLTKAVIRRKPAREEKTDFGRFSDCTAAKGSRASQAQDDREERKEKVPPTTVKTYRSLADARYEAKARHSKPDRYQDGEDSSFLDSH